MQLFKYSDQNGSIRTLRLEWKNLNTQIRMELLKLLIFYATCPPLPQSNSPSGSRFSKVPEFLNIFFSAPHPAFLSSMSLAPFSLAQATDKGLPAISVFDVVLQVSPCESLCFLELSLFPSLLYQLFHVFACLEGPVLKPVFSFLPQFDCCFPRDLTESSECKFHFKVCVCLFV